jgi:hypothetical protein
LPNGWAMLGPDDTLAEMHLAILIGRIAAAG